MLGWGASDFFAKGAADRIGHLRTVLYAQIASIAILGIYLVFDHSVPVLSIGNIGIAVLFALGNVLSYTMLYRSFEKGNVSLVSPISSSYVIIAVLISFIFLKEQVGILKAVSICLVIAGILIASVNLGKIRNGLRKGLLAKGVPEALIFMVVEGVWFPFWAVFVVGGGFAVWILIIKIIMVLCLAAYLTFIKRERLLPRTSIPFRMVFLISFFDLGAFLGNTWALSRFSSSTSIIVAVAGAYPLATIFLSHLYYKERLSVQQYLGIAVILGGIMLLPFIS
jgi:uncharacterized membrane protein